MELIAEFLLKNNLHNVERNALVGDASERRYERIVKKDQSCILMIDPNNIKDVQSFVYIDKVLSDNGLHAPVIIGADLNNGLVLLEDFGNTSFTKILEQDTDKELTLYSQATKVLDVLPTAANLPDYSNKELMREVFLFIEWYVPAADRDSFIDIWNRLFFKLSSEKILVLRDYHADNLFWLDNESGVKRVGLLDFQDALIGNRAYDYVSLLQDARRDVSEETVTELLKGKEESFMRDYYILGAQRNLKIIGIFHRLNKRDGKQNYLQYLPRVWKHLYNDLQYPDLSELKEWLDKNIPNYESSI